MIRYALQCADGHQFEAWFSSSADYDRLAEAGLLECAECGSGAVTKQIMAPAVRPSERRASAPAPAEAPAMTTGGAAPEGASDLAEAARKVQAHIRKHFDYVGPQFASEARAMHSGDKPERLIYGETTSEERKALKEDGVPCAPLPEPFAPTPPKKAN